MGARVLQQNCPQPVTVAANSKPTHSRLCWDRAVLPCEGFAPRQHERRETLGAKVGDSITLLALVLIEAELVAHSVAFSPFFVYYKSPLWGAGQLNNFPAFLISMVGFMTQFWSVRHRWVSAESF